VDVSERHQHGLPKLTETVPMPDNFATVRHGITA
jgi:hypothetical protein